MKTIDILNFIDSFAPFNTALPFDNAGLLVGSGEKEIKKIGIVLDVTAEAAEYAAQNGIHPYPDVKTVFPDKCFSAQICQPADGTQNIPRLNGYKS